MAYVEVRAKTVELAVEAAMQELGADDRGRVEVEVLQEPERGFLGLGGQDAIVRVRESAAPSRRGGRGRSRTRKEGEGSAAPRPSDRGGQRRPEDSPAQRKSGNDRSRGQRQERPRQARTEERDPVDIDAQEPQVREFLTGLLGAFGLEGAVETRVEGDVIVVEVQGSQTEALVGPRGSVMESVHELTKTVLQRTARTSARVRLDVAGYAQRRRQALAIYAEELIEQVLGDGGEVVLEPMSAADRKVVHDAVASRTGVKSYSEGESPQRFVVISRDESAEDESAEDESE